MGMFQLVTAADEEDDDVVSLFRTLIITMWDSSRISRK